MKKVNRKSVNIVKSNIEQLKALFPEVFADGKINFDQLRELLGDHVVQNEDHYNFTWHGKRKAGRLAQTPSTGTLRPCKEESLDWDTTQNIFIEGDNLEALKLLQKSYHRKVKMIYIDPPYNTGNDFVYEDDFKDGIKNYLRITGQVDSNGKKLGTNSNAAGRYHTNWLNMMYPRLKLARNLLRDDGVIFISIDDNEQANLKKLCDEIFGEENFVTIFCWEKKKKPSFLNKNVGSKFEYILAYAKSRENTHSFSVDLTEEGKKFPFNNAGNQKAVLKFPARSVRFNMSDQLICPQDMSEGKIYTELIDEVHISNGVNANEFSLRGEWRYSQETLDDIIKNGESIVISKIPFRPNHVKKGGEIKKMHNLLSIKHYDIQTNEDADAEQADLLGASFFDYTKPSGLIKLITRALTYNDSSAIILDFFAGSGTTAHAVTRLNAEDGYTRRCISMQLPELIDDTEKKRKDNAEAIRFLQKLNKPINIAEIAKERIRRAAKKIKAENPDYQGDLGFKVFKLDSSNIKRWEAGFATLEADLSKAVDHIKTDRSSEDLLYELLLKYSIDLTVPITTRTIADKAIHCIGSGELIVCLDDNITTEVVKGIGELKEKLQPETMRVVFRDDGFKDDVVKTNALQTLKYYGIEDAKSL